MQMQVMNFKKIFKYKKVMHDPLSYDESKKCPFHLIPQVYEASVKLKKEHIIHMDLCLPNFCFDKSTM